MQNRSKNYETSNLDLVLKRQKQTQRRSKNWKTSNLESFINSKYLFTTEIWFVYCLKANTVSRIRS